MWILMFWHGHTRILRNMQISYKIVIYANGLFFASRVVASTLYHRSYLDTLHVHWILSTLTFSMHVQNTIGSYTFRSLTFVYCIALSFVPQYPHPSNVLAQNLAALPDRAGINTSTTILISHGVATLIPSRMDSSETLTTPTSSRLPLELLQQIYNLLSPLDFDAARHTCRLWLFASLEKTLLTSQLRLGGWQAAAEQDLQESSNHFRKRRRQNAGDANSTSTSTSVSQIVSAEWVLSKRLAAETRLCPSWRGIWPSNWSSVTKKLDRQVPINGVQIPINKAPSIRGAYSSLPPLVCTVSGCGHFVLLAQDRVVFIYSLRSFKAGVTPLTSIFCHRRIVSMSMDTSCGRYAVGILLEGRIGVLCEVEMDKPGPPIVNRIHPSMSLSDFRNFDIRTTSRSHPRSSDPDQVDFDLSSPTRSRVHPRTEAYRRRGHALGRPGGVAIVRGTSLTLTDSNSHTGSGEEFNPPAPNASFHQFFPERYGGERINASLSQHYPFNNFDPITGTSVSIELGARKVYKNLCSIHDPPKSVAICPQRQCVAFGCKTGVELHWIDALRGSTLSR